MKNLYNNEKNKIILLIIFQVLIFSLSIIYYIFNESFFGIKKEFIFELVCGIEIVSNLFYLLSLKNNIEKKNTINSVKFNTAILNNLREIDVFGQIGIIFYDENFEIIWINDFLDNRKINLVGKNIIKYNNDFCLIIEDKKESIKTKLNNRIYECKCLKELKMIILKDINEYDQIVETYKNESPVILSINIDNYSDIMSLLDDSKAAELENKVRAAINEWAYNKKILIKRIRNDSYLCLTQEFTYNSILKEKFSIIEEIKNIKEDDNNFTISIGIGKGVNDFVKLSELSSSAIDVALARGGDQCVVNTYGKNMEFYGEGTEVKNKRHKVKVKVVSKSLTALMESFENIYVMGHIMADFDAIGACLGMYAIGKRMNKNIKIVYEDKLVEYKARSAFRQSFEKEEIDEMIIKPSKLKEEINSNCLLILVDVSNPSIVMNKEVLEVAENVAIIDHHRPGDKLDNQIFAYQESASSSSCEMVTELIRYSEDKVNITQEIATYMLTGILLDTNNYKNRTSSRTYEASMILKDYGADNTASIEFLKEEYEEYLLKTKILANSETPYYGIVVCLASNEDIIDKTILAKVGEETLDVKEVKACFVIGRTSSDEISISARSNGTVNVQKIMEQLNGGGHFSSAATQLKDITIEEAKNLLYSKLDDSVGDSRID